MDETNPKNNLSSNILTRLWRGDVPLVQTYWLWGVVGGISLRLISPQVTYFIVAHADSLSSGQILLIQNLWLTFVIICQVFIFIAIWRSANKYAIKKPKSKGNAVVAKIMVVLGALVLIGSLAKINDGHLTSSSSSADDRMHIDAAIRGLNVGLPKKLDEITTITKIDIHDDTIFYYMDISKVVTDRDAFRTKIRENLSATCHDKDLADILKGGNTLEWVYSDPSTKNFIHIDIKKTDCPNL